jgi:hypothetical protein
LISVILYGRNDAHGYNLHRRAALSLNCVAEILTDDDDEIVFVDYNTPDELPTFVEALADTLTARCLSRLRVLRVPAELHHERYRDLTHLPAVEPVCRNAAARRMNPANRWLLSTNTDMILVPHSDASLSDVCQDLDDGFYCLPRFELPEWLWEQLPRSDPRTVISEVRRLGPLLHLDESTPNEWVRFDAPGDFQLCLRDDYFAIDGCDERMLLGWHVDSNLSRRLLLHRGSIDTLEDALAGYHCNHSRTPTIYHGAEWIENDLRRFFLEVERAELPHQRQSWGLADTTLEEVSLGSATGVRFTDALVTSTPSGTHRRSPSSPLEARVAVTYDEAHVLPHVVDSIVVSGRHTTIGYLGANPVLREMVDRVVRELARESALEVVDVSKTTELEELANSVDLFIVDFGLAAPLAPELASQLKGLEAGDPDFPEPLRPVAVAFEELVRQERARLERGMYPRRFVLVNSATVYVNSFVVANLDCSGTSTHSRVRRATVRLVPTSEVHVLRKLRWDDRLEKPLEPLGLQVGQRATLGSLEEVRGFGPGWWFPDPNGIWTRGPRAVLALEWDGLAARPRPVLELTFDRVGVRRGLPVRVGLVIGESPIETRIMRGGTRLTTWRARLPQHAVAKRRFDVALEIEGDGVWADKNQLGLHLRTLGLATGLLPIALRNWIDRADETVRRGAGRSRRLLRRGVRRVLP